MLASTFIATIFVPMFYLWLTRKQDVVKAKEPIARAEESTPEAGPKS
jgi:hypothetical protein